MMHWKAAAIALGIVALAACTTSNLPDSPAGIDPDRPMAGLTRAEQLVLCEWSYEQHLQATGRGIGERYCEPDGMILSGPPTSCVLVPGFVSSRCTRKVSDYANCVLNLDQALVDRDLACAFPGDPMVAFPECFFSPECSECLDDVECQRCNPEDGCLEGVFCDRSAGGDFGVCSFL